MISTGNMWILEKNTPQQPGGLKQRVIGALLYCTGEMKQLHTHIQDKSFLLQLSEWCLRGISRVILLNNPLSGALILAALLLESPWQAMLGMLGLLASTLTAIMLGQDWEEVSSGLHGFNGMLVALLMGVFSSAGDWYWWLLLPVCLGGATTTFLSSSLAPVLERWDLPVSVFPFNTVIVLYLACTGTSNPYFPNYPAQPPGAPESTNHTQLHVPQLLQGVVLGVGQIFACDTLGPSLLILGAVFLFSPILAVHALLGSVISTVAGMYMSVQYSFLYSGLSGFNGALGCMVVGAFFLFSWRTHLLSIASALLSAYTDIALSNLLGVMGLPASSWAATLTGTLMLLLTGENLKEYRIPTGKVTSPEQNLHSHKQWSAANTNATDA
ncbi:urea transporter 2 [Rhinichthys klamathensis goyatoka]|uniref:urea transporter 2 n=1 Tax=Rhinichthys klamathensis goyatoka TaxID=3034132 RepID=UPI0024B53496|nr:urea transporter 2 [Rhinichthys klamathensis goyatoka]